MPALSTERVKRWRSRNPWWTHANNARRRCSCPTHSKYKFYGGKGIKYRLTFAQVRSLWERDGAAGMAQPSIDRIDAAGDYSLDNCRFVELEFNTSAPHVQRRKAVPA